MNVALWVIAGVLAAVFIVAGALKLTQTKQELVQSGLGWTEQFSTAGVKLIGLLEALAAMGLILPPLVRTGALLVPLTATGLGLLMVGAAITHVRRREPSMIVVNVVLLALAVVVAWGRFACYASIS